MNILITGATGFLGGHLADACLRDGHRVRALVRPGGDTARLSTLGPGIDLVPGDLADTASLARAAIGCDTVLHSAARVVDHGSRAQFEEANVAGTQRLLAAVRAAGATRFVFVSSPSALMHLREGDRLRIDESTPYPTRFFNHYCATKAAAERYVLAANTADFTTCALRPRGIWGPRDHAGFLPRMIASMREGRLPDLSGGKRVRVSLCHVDNAVDACLRAAAAPAERIGGKAYFIADREETDLWAFLTDVGSRLGCPPPRPRIPVTATRALAAAVETAWRLRPSAATGPPLSRYTTALLTRSTTYDTAAARRDLGYDPPRTREDGVSGLLRWIHANGGVQAWTQPGRTRTDQGTTRR
ncbi:MULTISPECIES: NAD-dependent epimerase/dehydratase family protein [unclassified Streptomyces]|uniref:NAD-dependent epimerase/dehydratase family protein n=1 Tax=unclassified Streptomyces TaxID=2593676 RepID=UPI00331FF171